MSNDQRQRHHGLADMPPSNKGVFDVAADRTLAPYERLVRARAAAGTGAFTITLPPAPAAIGIFSIGAITADATNSVTVADPAGAEGLADVVLDADGEAAILYSDGIRWHQLA